VDDHIIVRECISAVLEREADLEVVGLASSGDQAISVAQQHKPDLVVMDLMLPGLNGNDATQRLLALCPRTKVIMLSTSFTTEHVTCALKAGAHGYVAKDAAASDLVCAVRTVMAGDRYLSPQIYAPLGVGRLDSTARRFWEQLSVREREVLRQTADGVSIADIATQLSLSPKTVATYRSRLMQKLGFSSRSTLIRFTLQQSRPPSPGIQ
jgi:DNA-binding NarL/FixJ family response regulator